MIVHNVSGEATLAALTLMHVSYLCPRAAVSSQPVLGRVIRRADTGYTHSSL